ncbi:MAG TPA: DNA replication and repair protein RecF, partial [Flavobacteriales bacterium]|nr:DNA replication and repair protein RecF [Flavobacteriales bacterium]
TPTYSSFNILTFIGKMHLKRLQILNFKNLPEEEFGFIPGVNLLLGHNGQGKTNVLDAIHYLSLCKSCFNPIDSQNIMHNEAFFVIQGEFEHDTAVTEIYCGQKRGQKKIFKKNKKEYEKLADHIGMFPLVIVSPADSDLVNEGSVTRRKFIDSIISQFDKQYLEYLIAYNKVLEQRNSLFRFGKGKTVNTDLVEVYNQQLSPLGQKIYEKRKQFIADFTPWFNTYFSGLSNAQNETVTLHYQSKLHDSTLEHLLQMSFDQDRFLEYTTCGIHKDDIELKLNGYAVKKYGSQGQQKSFVIALKLAQHAFIKHVKGFSPLLLLDDIFDKLDANRVRYLLKLVTEKDFGQVFITDTDLEKTPLLLAQQGTEANVVRIEQGRKMEVNKTAIDVK